MVTHLPAGYGRLHPYGQVIVDEAHRRGITVEVIDPDWGELRLSHRGRTVGTRDSLSELTTALALNRCQDKRTVRRALQSAGVAVPRGREATGDHRDIEFLAGARSVVVKPARGAEASGVTVNVTSEARLLQAIELSRQHCPDVVIEQMCHGPELRVLVIDYRVVAAAVRRPASVTGDGVRDITALLADENERRSLASGGKYRIPADEVTSAAVRHAGFSMRDVLPLGTVVAVRPTVNVHVDVRDGGTMSDILDDLHPEVASKCVAAARALDMPVVGLDLILASPTGPEHAVIDANERPGLANYAPRPVVERFMDLLFPATRWCPHESSSADRRAAD